MCVSVVFSIDQKMPGRLKRAITPQLPIHWSPSSVSIPWIVLEARLALAAEPWKESLAEIALKVHSMPARLPVNSAQRAPSLLGLFLWAWFFLA